MSTSVWAHTHTHGYVDICRWTEWTHTHTHSRFIMEECVQSLLTHTHTEEVCVSGFKTENQIKDGSTQREFALFAFMCLPQFTLEFGANLSFRTSKHCAGRPCGDFGTTVWHNISVSLWWLHPSLRVRLPLSSTQSRNTNSNFLHRVRVDPKTEACWETESLLCVLGSPNNE